jgi:uncharacterized phage protein (TIGR02216 family)
MSEQTPWRHMLSAGIRFGIAPCAFWRLSLREWRALNASPSDVLNRAAFEALVAAHPDKSP